MDMQLTSADSAFSLPAGGAEPGRIGDTAEYFADLVRQEDVAAFLFARDRERLIEYERLCRAAVPKRAQTTPRPEALATAAFL